MMIENELLQVILRAREGDRTAYGELVERFQSTVYAVAWPGCATRPRRRS
jgi:hypothetical protein